MILCSILKKVFVAIILSFFINSISFAQQLTNVNSLMFAYPFTMINNSNGKLNIGNVGISDCNVTTNFKNTFVGNKVFCESSTQSKNFFLNKVSVNLPFYESINFDGRNIEPFVYKEQYEYQDTTYNDYFISHIKGFNDQSDALSNIFQFDGNLELTTKGYNGKKVHQVLLVTGCAVLHVRDLSILNNSRIIVNGDKNAKVDVCKTSGSLLLISENSISISDNNKKIADNKEFSIGNSWLLAKNSIIIGKDARINSRLSSPNITIKNTNNSTSSSIIISNTSWALPNPIEQVTYAIEGGGYMSLCETPKVKILSNSSSPTTVNVSLDSRNIATFEDGTTSKDVTVSSSNPAFLTLIPKGKGQVKVNLLSTSVSYFFVDSVLSFFTEKKVDSNSLFLNGKKLYAGEFQNIYAVVVSPNLLNPKQCQINPIKPSDIISMSVESTTQVKNIVDQNKQIIDSSSLIIEDGFIAIPKFTYYDSGEVSVNVSLKNDDTDITNSFSFNTSPFAIMMSIDTLPKECKNDDCFSYNEKYYAGSDLRLKFIPKSWCTAIKSTPPYSMDEIANCETLPSYNENLNSTLLYAFLIKDDSKEANIDILEDNFIGIKNILFDKNVLKENSAFIQTNYVTDVGKFSFFIDEYTDSKTLLTVNSSVLHNVGYFAPYSFSVMFNNSPYMVINGCSPEDENQIPFTYYGQNFGIDASIVALTARNEIATNFHQDYYEPIKNYYLDIQPYIFKDASFVKLVNTVNNESRIDKCISCQTLEEKELWNSGFLTLKKTDLIDSRLFYSVLPLNITKNDIENSLSLGTNRTDYRKESPSLVNGSLSPFYVYVGAGINICKEENCVNKFYANMNYEFSYYRVDGTQQFDNTLFSVLQEQWKSFYNATGLIELNGSLDLRMGRIVLENARSNTSSSMFLPIKLEYYRSLENNDGEWVLNRDDSCTELGRQNFYVTPYASTSNIEVESLISKNNFNYQDNQTSTVEIINERNLSLKEMVRSSNDHYSKANMGKLYLRISAPSNNSPTLFMMNIHSTSDRSSSIQTDWATPLRIYNESSNIFQKNPIWFGITNESIDHSFGAFREWPGNDRIIYKMDNSH